jgi:hypothetical protein
MPRRPLPTQPSLPLEGETNHPPTAPATPEVIATLADLLLAAMAGSKHAEAGDERQDRA